MRVSEKLEIISILYSSDPMHLYDIVIIMHPYKAILYHFVS